MTTRRQESPGPHWLKRFCRFTPTATFYNRLPLLAPPPPKPASASTTAAARVHHVPPPGGGCPPPGPPCAAALAVEGPKPKVFVILRVEREQRRPGAVVDRHNRRIRGHRPRALRQKTSRSPQSTLRLGRSRSHQHRPIVEHAVAVVIHAGRNVYTDCRSDQ